MPTDYSRNTQPPTFYIEHPQSNLEVERGREGRPWRAKKKKRTVWSRPVHFFRWCDLFRMMRKLQYSVEGDRDNQNVERAWDLLSLWACCEEFLSFTDVFTSAGYQIYPRKYEMERRIMKIRDPESRDKLTGALSRAIASTQANTFDIMVNVVLKFLPGYIADPLQIGYSALKGE